MLFNFSIFFAALLTLFFLLRFRSLLDPCFLAAVTFLFSLILARGEYLYDPIGYFFTNYSGPSTKTCVYLFLASAALLVGSVLVVYLLRIRSVPPQMVFRILPQPQKLYLAFAAICVSEFLISTAMNDFVPRIFSISAGGGGYSDFSVPLLTPLSWAAAKFQYLYLLTEYLFLEKSIVEHIKRQRWCYFFTAISLFCNLTAGLRVNVIIPALLAIWLVSLKEKRAVRFIVPSLAALGVFFIVFGNLRSSRGGEFSETDILNFTTGSEFVDGILAWPVTYLATSVANLDQIIGLNPNLSHGVVLIEQFVPLSSHLLGDAPETIQYLTGQHRLPYRGLTFRSAFADLYIDFGYWGSLLAGILLFLSTIALRVRLFSGPSMAFVALDFMQGLIYFDFLNVFGGLPNVLPILLYFVLTRKVVIQFADRSASPN